ncbi:MAG: L-serine ammonia-lyase, iron-sulfur-dependent, subunit alpha [Peptoniphilus sp.]|nr:L-serine ammonia-lyase, iron-sulfur-dependent, subunit alpha [Peptoniphilus sp.]MDD7363209.1 L-serine ammonia-lyase, iron-sulfur-dependent, subunit alpha [Bacillota bacterium]MDY6044467.1 L-serine ammonia-lyase, iron-sulfur-dependent, subunit alpha [Peptoniphilus sp.]
MLKTAKELIEVCRDNDWKISDYVLEDESKGDEAKKREILDELGHMLAIMKESTSRTLQSGSNLSHDMIRDFGKKTWEYAHSGRKLVSDEETVRAMARAFSTFESNSKMNVIVAAPTAGSCGIVPAALTTAQEDLGIDDEALARGLLVAIGIGQFIGGYGTFAGSEGGCQAECGAASSMAAGALAELYGGSVEDSLNAASIAIVNILGLVCDPLGGLVQYPCTFRNASGVSNARISADLALAGTYSIVPFDEVCQAMKEVGDAMPAALRETGIGGLAGTKTAGAICKQIFSE